MFTLNNFYQSDEWINLLNILKSERINDKDGLLYCEHCNKPIIKKYDCIGHHKLELTNINVNDYNISLNPDNIMLIHHKCHNIIHQRFEGFKQTVYIVYGSPCSGKTTWVNEVANKDDLILDIDKLWEAICLSDKYNKPNRLKANVFGLRDILLDQIKCRLGMWRNAYIIGGYPLATDRARLANKLGAELIFIDTDKSTCLSRAINKEWEEYIEEWFDMYQE